MVDTRQKTFYVLWSYLSSDEEGKPFIRRLFFYAGSVNYGGWWMGPSDCVWMIPNLNDWVC